MARRTYSKLWYVIHALNTPTNIAASAISHISRVNRSTSCNGSHSQIMSFAFRLFVTNNIHYYYLAVWTSTIRVWQLLLIIIITGGQCIHQCPFAWWPLCVFLGLKYIIFIYYCVHQCPLCPSVSIVSIVSISVHCIHQCPLCSSVPIVFISTHCVHQCPLCSSVPIASISAHCVHQCPLCPSVPIVFITTHCVHQYPWCLSVSIVSISYRCTCSDIRNMLYACACLQYQHVEYSYHVPVIDPGRMSPRPARQIQLSCASYWSRTHVSDTSMSNTAIMCQLLIQDACLRDQHVEYSYRVPVIDPGRHYKMWSRQ